MRSCKIPRCNNPVSEGSFCQLHTPLRVKIDNRTQNAAQRGYLTPEWIRLSTLLKKKYPLCLRCQALQLEPNKTTEIHHIILLDIAPELQYDLNNLLPVCHKCHMGIHSSSEHQRLQDEYLQRKK